MDRVNRFRIIRFPHVVAGGKILVNHDSMRLERPNVKGQHPRKLLKFLGGYKSV